jgi:hypothetical protein
MIDSGVFSTLWTYVVEYSIYIINRTSESDNDLTPLESYCLSLDRLALARALDIGHLHRLDCHAFISRQSTRDIMRKLRNSWKFDTRAVVGYFLTSSEEIRAKLKSR